MKGVLIPWCVYAIVLALHLVLPAHRVRGYVKDASGTPLVYRLNGLPVLLVVIALAATCCAQGLLPWDFLWVHRWASLGGAIVLGLAFSIAIVVIAPSTGRSFLADLFLGRLENPRMLGGRFDLKMFLYQVGATMLALNLLSFAAHHAMVHAVLSPGVLLYTALLGWFLLDYLFFERVHLYTYDLFAERVGFKLGFGCLAFYPYFYVVGLWATAELPDPGRSTAWYVAAAVVFFVGWSLARGANMQKFFFKLDPTHRFLGIFAPEVVTDGKHTLLCSGFWAVSRHVNYLGEILMATGLALALGWPGELGPWAYPLYYALLLVPRERDDHRRCALKYGALWDEYCRRVPRRIVPGLY
jgi:protein-S-isoprenylcysteine O-methyltransferase Ste14